MRPGNSTVNIEPVAVNDFQIPWEGGPARVIGLVEGQIVTESLEDEPSVEPRVLSANEYAALERQRSAP